MIYPPNHILKAMNPNDRKALGKRGRTQEEILSQTTAKGEGELQGNLINLLRLRDIAYLSVRFGKRTRITVSWPDITFCYEGVPVAWEVKFGKEKPSDEQKAMHVRMARDGWKIFIIRTIQEGKACLDAIYLQQHPL